MLRLRQDRCGAKFKRRVEHGVMHSLYIRDPNGYGGELLHELPRDVWEADIDGARNFSVQLPTEGPEALADRTQGLPKFGRSWRDAVMPLAR
jgi:catechol 2,3-dioxygenase